VANWRQCARMPAPSQSNVGLPYKVASLDQVLTWPACGLYNS
jgi:hypothetical protein